MPEATKTDDDCRISSRTLDFIRQTAAIPISQLTQQLNGRLERIKVTMDTLINSEFPHFRQNVFDRSDEDGNNAEADLLENVQRKLGQVILSVGACYDQLSNSISEQEQRFLALEAKREETNRIVRLRGLINDLECIGEIVDTNYEAIPLLDLEVAAHLSQNVKESLKIVDEGHKDTLAKIHAHLQGIFQQKLIHSATTILQAGHSKEQFSILQRIYTLIDDIPVLRKTFQSQIVDPFIAQTLKSVERESLKTMAGLCLFYSRLMTFAKIVLEEWFTDFEMFPTECIIYRDGLQCPILEAILKNLPFIFSPAFPDTFHMSFRISTEFIRGLQAMSPTALSETQAYQDFMRSWQLNVYFQIRFKDFAVSIDTLYSNLRLEGGRQTGVIGFVNEYRRIFDDLWSDRVILDPLIPRFLRLTMQAFGVHSQFFTNQLSAVESGSCEVESLKSLQSLLLLQKHSAEYFTELLDEVVLPRIEDAQLQSAFKQNFYEALERFMAPLVGNITLTLGRCLAKHTTIAINQLDLYNTSSDFKNPLITSFQSLLQNSREIGIEDLLPWEEWAGEMLDAFGIFAQSQLEASKKRAAHFQRLVSVMKESASEDDRKALVKEQILQGNVARHLEQFKEALKRPFSLKN